MKTLEACLAYFSESPVFYRLLRGFYEKMESYGTFGGSVKVTFQNPEEREALEGFLQKNYQRKRKAMVSARQFSRALAESRFAAVAPEQILQQRFGTLPISRREQQERMQQAWTDFWKKLQQSSKDLLVQQWVADILGEQPAGKDFYPALKRSWNQGKQNRFQDRVEQFVQILENLPSRKEGHCSLALFAARLTGNPHGFDRDQEGGHDLEKILSWYAAQQGEKEQHSSPVSLRRQQLLFRGGLLVDEISNAVTLYGLRALDRNGKPHPGMDGFTELREPVQVPLLVLAGWRQVQCFGLQAYMVENPSVFAMLARGRKTVICGNGQPRLALLQLLKLMGQAGIHILYAGDLDPEGLLIAQNLKKSYEGPFSFWHMSVEDYQSSNPQKAVSPRRLKLLERITDPELLPVAKLLRERKRAGYQENIPGLWSEMGK